jgi:hypothetical protein
MYPEAMQEEEVLNTSIDDEIERELAQLKQSNSVDGKASHRLFTSLATETDCGRY